MPKGLVRSGSWRSLARALELAGTENVQELQVEPAQPVLDLDRLTRYGAGFKALPVNDGWVTLTTSVSQTGIGLNSQGLNVYGVAGISQPADVDFWVYSASVHVTFTAASDVGSAAVILAPLAASAFGTSAAQGVPVFVCSTSNDDRALTSANSLFLINRADLTRPIRIDHENNQLTLFVRNVAAGGIATYRLDLKGRFMPSGMPPQ